MTNKKRIGEAAGMEMPAVFCSAYAIDIPEYGKMDKEAGWS
ncbi:hypothetical protein ACP26L_12875 [Paenibacillus sp. S-38]